MMAARPKYLTMSLPLIIAAVAFVLSRMAYLDTLERRLLDERFKLRGPRSVVHSPFQLATIDDQTFETLQQKWPLRTSLYARAIENLNRAGARLIVFDVQFAEPHPLYPDDDSLFARAIAQAKNVILAGKISYTHDPKLEKPYAVPVAPLPRLTHAGAPWGLVNEITDPDDFTRRYLVCLPLGDVCKPSLGLEVLRAHYGLSPNEQPQFSHKLCRFGPLQIPLYDRQSFLINYSGPSRTFPDISLASILDDSALDMGVNDSNFMERFYAAPSGKSAQISGNPFAGRIVMIGAGAEELHDMKNTPFYAVETTPRKMSGVEMHAHAMQTILDRSFILRSPGWLTLLLNVILSFLIFFGVAALKPWRGLALSLLLLVVFCLAGVFAFARYNYWLDWMAPLLCVLLAYLSTSLYHYFLEKRQRARIQEMFAHYVPNQVVEELIASPELLKLGGERRRLTVLFADIWNFTSLSEKMPAEAIVILLNEYMTAMTEIILKNSGIIDKYEGDLIMAEFGAPVPYEDHGLRACRAALQMQNRLAELRRQWSAAGKPEITARIGINTGDVIIGNMGSRDVFDYTVIGDAVNVCSRLEKANKTFGTGILISQATKDALPAEFVTRPLGNLRVRGRHEAVSVYELLAENADALSPARRQHLELYMQGWVFYQKRAWDRASAALESALQLEPTDCATQMLLQRCCEFRVKPPPENWDGAIDVSLP